MAGQGTEVELKLMLTDEAAYAQVRNALDRLSQPKIARQINYYLDTTRLELRRQRAMVRVRVADDRAILTCKTAPRLQGGVQRVAESERELHGAAARAWLQGPPPRVALEDLDLVEWLASPLAEGGLLEVPLPARTALHTLGALANIRRTYALDLAELGATAGQAGPVLLELDRTTYPAEVERFELELEHPHAEALAPIVRAYLERLGVDAAEATESKYAQFLRLSDQPLPGLGGDQM